MQWPIYLAVIELAPLFDQHFLHWPKNQFLDFLGFQNLIDSKDKILAYLKENGGKSHLHDKSSPQDIRNTLGMSKQTFKNTIGMLYRERKIVITKNGIHLP